MVKNGSVRISGLAYPVVARSGGAGAYRGSSIARAVVAWTAASVTTAALVIGALTVPASASAGGVEAVNAADPFDGRGILTYGAAPFLGSPAGDRLAAPIVSMTGLPTGRGYWLAGANGAVFAYGQARNYGGAERDDLRSPVVNITATPDGEGYWLVTAGGSVWAYGDAHDYGSITPGATPYPVVGFASTPDGEGYWMATSHGQVYSFGEARYHGSLGQTNLHSLPVVAIGSSQDGDGYWLVQGGGEVVPYGDAPRLGEMRGHPPVVGMAVTPDGRGYWLACGDGEVDAFGDAKYMGGNNEANPRPPIASIVADAPDGGYWLLDAQAFRVTFSGVGSMRGADTPRASSIVSIAASQLGPSSRGGGYCNPYGPCEEWCALFATWVWERAGVAIPRYAFVGDVYYWAHRHTAVLRADARPRPGDLVLYGTGPQSVRTSPHIGVVAQVWPDGAIDTVEGDAGPGRGGWTSVLVNGPYYPGQSFFANGMPIYGFAVP
jgi:CHAP domain